MRRTYPTRALVFVSVLLLALAANVATRAQAQSEEAKPVSDSEESTEAVNSDFDVEDARAAAQHGTYPEEPGIDKPGDIESDLNTSFPKRDSVFPDLVPERWTAIKKNLYEKHHLKLATSYQSLFMRPSDVLFGESLAAAGFFLFEGKWEALRPGKDYQGSLTFSLFDIHPYGSASEPVGVFAQIGSIYVPEGTYTDIDFAFNSLFWEQWLGEDRVVLRLGQQQVITFIDFFRFADFRTSFSNPQLSFPATVIPFAPPGPGLSFKWLPRKDSELYVVGSAVDVNSEIDELDWSPLWEEWDLFTAIEVGQNWKRMGKHGGELDHVHLLVFHGDAPTLKAFPSKSGWGAKLAGEKQWGKFVTFGNYAYNTSRGGGFGFTFQKHVVNMGLAYNKPLRFRGEAAVAYTWVESLDGGGCGIVPCNGETQSGIEAYWKLLLTPDLWITPGLQVAINPAFNPEADVVWIPTFRFRAFF